MKKQIFQILILVWFFSLVGAYNLEKTKINDIAIHSYDVPAEFLFKFTNASNGYYEIFTFVDVKLLPDEKFLIENSTEEILVKVYPTKRIENIKGLYSFIFYINNPKGDNREERLRINLKEVGDLFEVYSEANLPKSEVSFYLENKENISLKKVKAKFKSVLFEEERVFDVNPLEKKEFFFKVDEEKMKKIPAGSYLLEVTFISPEGKEYKKEGKIIFGEKKEIFNDYKKTGYLIKEENLIKKNLGNTIENVQFSIEKNIFSYFLVYFNEKPDKIEKTLWKRTYYWNKKLGPSESSEIKIKTNFLILLILPIFVVGVGYIIKKHYSENLTIKKFVFPLRTKGGEFAVKVRIKIKANKSVRNLSLNDKITSILSLYKKFDSITPPNIIDEKNGRLTWNLGDLQEGEERILSYILYSKVGVYGKLSFSEASAIYEKGTKIMETFSNKVFFLSEQVKKN